MRHVGVRGKGKGGCGGDGGGRRRAGRRKGQPMWDEEKIWVASHLQLVLDGRGPQQLEVLLQLVHEGVDAVLLFVGVGCKGRVDVLVGLAVLCSLIKAL